MPGLISLSGLRPAQRQRRQLTSPGWEPAVTSPLSAPKAARTSAFSRSGTLKSSTALISSRVTSSNTSGEILRSQCASRISKPVYWNGPRLHGNPQGSSPLQARHPRMVRRRMPLAQFGVRVDDLRVPQQPVAEVVDDGGNSEDAAKTFVKSR